MSALERVDLSVWFVSGYVPLAIFFVGLLVASVRRGWPWSSAALATAALIAGLAGGTALMPSIIGAMAGGVAAWLLAQRILGVERPPLFTIALGASLVVAFGRIGCFVSGCCFGTVTGLPWAVQHDAHTPVWGLHRAMGLIDGHAPHSLAVHPYPL